FLNYGRPPLDDVRVRQALNYAINREEINKVIVLGLGEPTSAILPKQHWACDEATVNYYGHAPDNATRLWADAGYATGLELDAYGWPDQTAMQRQELIVSQLAKAGFRVKLTPVPPGQAMQNFLLEKKGAMLISPTGGYPDPSQFYDAMFGKDALRNAAKIEIPGYRELVDATMAAQDPPARKGASAKLQRFVIEHARQGPQFISPHLGVARPQGAVPVANLAGTP